MVTEGVFYHSILKTIKQSVALKSRTSPLSVFYFNFTGPYSQSYLDTNTFGDFGIVHADELLYLFRGSREVPDFQVGSPAWYMAKIIVDYYVDIAYNGYEELLCCRCFMKCCLNVLLFQDCGTPLHSGKLSAAGVYELG